MNIKRLYESSLQHNNPTLVSYHYKLNKGLVNVLYPVFGKCEYGIDASSSVIVSLTTYPARIDTVYLTVMTLLNQTVKPKAVILWLADEQFPEGENGLPHKLQALKNKGLTIKFCEDLRPHKKYYYTMMENPDCDVITVDDDVFYPEDLVETLVNTSEKYPDTVVCTWGHGFVNDENGDVFSANKWQYLEGGNVPAYTVIPTGIGGVFYPAHCLSEEVFNAEAIKSLCLNADDLWLKAMALLNHKKAVRVDRTAKLYFSILKTQKSGLFYDNALKNKNDEAWGNIMNAYPECRKILIDNME